jgi:hypothetical protein
VQPCELALRLLAVRRSLLLSRELTIQPGELAQVLPQRLRRLDRSSRLAVVDDGGSLQAEIEADDVRCPPYRFLLLDRLRLDLDAERDEPAVGVATDRRRDDPTFEAPRSRSERVSFSRTRPMFGNRRYRSSSATSYRRAESRSPLRLKRG